MAKKTKAGTLAPTFTATYGDDVFVGAANTAYTLHGLYGNDTLSGGELADKLYGDQNNDTLSGGGGSDRVDGGTGNDTLNGGAGADTVLGGAGNDRVIVSSRADGQGDVLNGGEGIDTLQIDFSAETQAVSLVARLPEGKTNVAGAFTAAGFEIYQIVGGRGNDTITGYLLGDTLKGGDGSDRLSGVDGDDKLFGEGGDDTLDGGSGKDTIVGGAGADKIEGRAGDDNLSSDELLMDHKVEIDTLNGGAGNDLVSIGRGDIADGGSAAGEVNTVRLTLTTSKVAENFTFNTGKITLAEKGSIIDFHALQFEGGSGADKVTGGDRDDMLNGGVGNDALNGGKGADVMIGGLGDDVIHGNAGDDIIVEDANMTRTGVDKYYGDSGSDMFVVTGHGLGQAKTFDGGGSKDDSPEDVDTVTFLQVELSASVDLTNQARNDGAAKGHNYANVEMFIGSSRDDIFVASATGMVFNAGDGDDVLIGGAGDDVLTGGEGSDVLTGGKGADMFDLSEFNLDDFGDDFPDIPGLPDDLDDVPDHNHWQGDRITDFVSGTDTITLMLSDFDLEGPFDYQLVNGTAATARIATFIFDKNTDQLTFDADGIGADHSAVLIATLDNVAALAAYDLIAF